MGVSLLTNVGLPELIATDERDYLDIAARLAGDPARLNGYRSSLRARMAASPLCDSIGFSRRFEAMLRQAWTQWCSGSAQVNQALGSKVMQAKALLDQGKADACIAALRRLGPKALADPDVNTLLSMAHAQLNQMDQAVYYSRRALEADADNLSHASNLATLLAGAGKIDEALTLARSTLARSPSQHEARLLIVNHLLDAKQASEAARMAREGLDISWHPALSVSYAAALLVLKENELAVTFLREAMQRFPDEPQLYTSFATAITALKENEEGVEFLRAPGPGSPTNANSPVPSPSTSTRCGAPPPKKSRWSTANTANSSFSEIRASPASISP